MSRNESTRRSTNYTRTSENSGESSSDRFKLSDYIRVNPGFPCPVCWKPDWCVVHKDGSHAYCNRVESPHHFGDRGWWHGLELGDLSNIPAATPPEKLPIETVERYVQLMVENGRRFAAVPKLARLLGVSPIVLREMRVGWNVKSCCYSFPMRDAAGQFCGVRYRFPDGRKRSLKGSNEGLFFSPWYLSSPGWFICEGPSDAAALLTMGLPTIGRPNCGGGCDQIISLVLTHRPRWVVIIADRDAAGSKAEQFTRMGYTRLADRITAKGVPTRIISTIHHKDSREYLLTGGTAEGIIQALSGRSDQWKIHGQSQHQHRPTLASRRPNTRV